MNNTHAALLALDASFTEPAHATYYVACAGIQNEPLYKQFPIDGTLYSKYIKFKNAKLSDVLDPHTASMHARCNNARRNRRTALSSAVPLLAQAVQSYYTQKATQPLFTLHVLRTAVHALATALVEEARRRCVNDEEDALEVIKYIIDTETNRTLKPSTDYSLMDAAIEGKLLQLSDYL